MNTLVCLWTRCTYLWYYTHRYTHTQVKKTCPEVWKGERVRTQDARGRVTYTSLHLYIYISKKYIYNKINSNIMCTYSRGIHIVWDGAGQSENVLYIFSPVFWNISLLLLVPTFWQEFRVKGDGVRIGKIKRFPLELLPSLKLTSLFGLFVTSVYVHLCLCHAGTHTHAYIYIGKRAKSHWWWERRRRRRKGYLGEKNGRVYFGCTTGTGVRTLWLLTVDCVCVKCVGKKMYDIKRRRIVTYSRSHYIPIE